MLVLLAAGALFVLTDYTDRLFAWTVKPNLTAAFLGAGYLPSFFLEYLSAREIAWAAARISVPAVLVFTLLTLGPLVHRDRFHFSSPHPVARFAAWAWLAIYAIVPLLMLLVLVRQVRVPGGDLGRTRRMPAWGRVVVALQAGVVLGLGVALFARRAAALWPWALTPLTGRAIGAWLVGIGVAAFHALAEGDLRRLRAAG
ncbi:MAG: hypothetical protein ACRDJ4_06365 [Actinomycetota bacterium]